MDNVIYETRQSEKSKGLESKGLHSPICTGNSSGPVCALAEPLENHVQLMWPLSFASPQLGENDVHVWAFYLDVSPASLQRFESFLSLDERERASRFHFEQHRNRYVAGRGWLRELLGAYVDVSPDKIKFDYGLYGKPAFSQQSARKDIDFNLAHSDSFAVAGVTHTGPLGLDLERVRPLEDMGELVKRFFSQRESSLFEQLKREKQLSGFFNLWTRKEAWLKATGQGISHYLNQVEVSFLPEQSARLLKLPEGFPPAHEWSLHDLNPGCGLKGALAIAAKEARISCWQWCDVSNPA